MVKAFEINVYKDGQKIFSLPLSSRIKTARYLRNQGLKFRDSALTGNLDTEPLILNDRETGLVYKVIPSQDRTEKVIHDNAVYIPLNDYCVRTGRKRDAVYKSYQRGRIRGLTIGKYNLVYIYWESLR